MLSKIENIICAGEGLTPAEIHVKNRKNDLKETRQMVMYFAKLMTNKTLSDIGGYYGLDHATASHAFRTIENLMETDKSFRERMLKHQMRLKVIKIDKMVVTALDAFRPLEFEVLKLESKVIELKNMIENVKIELEILNKTN